DETDDILIEVDHLACSRSKVDPAQVVDTLNTFFSSRIAGIYHGKNLHEQVYIVVRIAKQLREDSTLLKTLTVPNALRINIPLAEVTKQLTSQSVKPLWRENHHQTIYLTGEMGERSVTYAGIDLLTK